MKLNEGEKHVLVHALTGSNDDRKVYRNHFAAGPGHHDAEHIERLVEAGLMIAGAIFNDNGSRYFHCTKAGARAVGLSLPHD